MIDYFIMKWNLFWSGTYENENYDGIGDVVDYELD